MVASPYLCLRARCLSVYADDTREDMRVSIIHSPRTPGLLSYRCVYTQRVYHRHAYRLFYRALLQKRPMI